MKLNVYLSFCIAKSQKPGTSELNEERIDYELKEEYGTSSRKEVAKIMIDDLEMSSEDEAKKLFLQEILSLEKRSNDID